MVTTEEAPALNTDIVAQTARRHVGAELVAGPAVLLTHRDEVFIYAPAALRDDERAAHAAIA